MACSSSSLIPSRQLYIDGKWKAKYLNPPTQKIMVFEKSKPSLVKLALERNHGFQAKASAINGTFSLSGTTIKEKQEGGRIMVIDNYDSFTYNLCQYLGDLGSNFEVYRNDEITVEEIRRKNPQGIVISPGPGAPKESGISLEVVEKLGPSIPIFGVCMGLQCIGEAFGGKIVRAPQGVMHGKSSKVFYDENDGADSLFSGLSNPFLAARYHSLVIEEESFPHEELKITAWTKDGLVMGVRHKRFKHIQAVQFHPESIITVEGKIIVENFLKSLNPVIALN